MSFREDMKKPFGVVVKEKLSYGKSKIKETVGTVLEKRRERKAKLAEIKSLAKARGEELYWKAKEKHLMEKAKKRAKIRATSPGVFESIGKSFKEDIKALPKKKSGGRLRVVKKKVKKGGRLRVVKKKVKKKRTKNNNNRIKNNGDFYGGIGIGDLI